MFLYLKEKEQLESKDQHLFWELYLYVATKTTRGSKNLSENKADMLQPFTFLRDFK